MAVDHPFTSTLLDIQQQLGIIQGQLGIVMTEQGRSTDRRSAIYDRIGTIDEKVNEVRGKLDTVIDDIAELKPTVKDLDSMRQQGAGIVWILRFLWAAAGGLVGAIVVKYGFPH